MSVKLTRAAEEANLRINKRPNVVLKIDGTDVAYTAAPVKSAYIIGDDFEIGEDDFTIGGSFLIDMQESLISFQGGTTTSFSQQVNIDTGTGSSIKSIQVALIDLNKKITSIVAPTKGGVTNDMLGKKCTLFFGYEDTQFPEDFVRVFKGNIDEIDSGQGLVRLNIIGNERKLLGSSFLKKDTELTADITISSSTITVDSTEGFLVNNASPETNTDIGYYVRIDDEIIKYTGLTSTTFTGCTRGQLGTSASAHSDGDSVESYFRIEGNIMDVALRFMLSGVNDNYVTGLSISSFQSGTNEIILEGIDLKDEHNISVGDFLTITDSINTDNNVVNAKIIRHELLEDVNTLIVLDSALINEVESTALASIRSKYDVYGPGRGLNMIPDEVDIDAHESIRARFLPSFQVDFYIKDTIESGKAFIDSEIYNVISCFALNRSTRASVEIQAPPQPGAFIQSLNLDNVTNANNLSVTRSTAKNFYNGVVFKIEDLPLENRFLKREIVLSADSIDRFSKNIPNTFLNIDASGARSSMRLQLRGLASRRLSIYEFGAEYIKQVTTDLKTGLTIEAGDIVLVDFTALQLTDKETGTREGQSRLFRVDRKSFDLKTGKVTLDITDTQFNKDARFGLVSPASIVLSASSSTQLTVKPSFSDPFLGQEFRKWSDLIGIRVVIRNKDFTVTSGPVDLISNTGNTFNVGDMGFTPTEGMIMELAHYDELGSGVGVAKTLYAFLSDGDLNFTSDEGPAYELS